jgi:hypothetical protein
LRLQGLVEPAIRAVLQVEGAHVRDVTGLGCLGVVARLPIDELDRAHSRQGKTGTLIKFGDSRVTGELRTDLLALGTSCSRTSTLCGSVSLSHN